MYVEIDQYGDQVLNETERQNWVDQNLDAICGEERKVIVKSMKKAEFNDALKTAEFKAAFKFFDANKNKQLGKSDTRSLIKALKNDANFTEAG